MWRILPALFLFLAFQSFAQTRPESYIFATFDIDKESAKDFKKKTNAFIKKIASSPGTSGFIAIRANKYSDSLEFRRIAVEAREKRKDLRSRIDIWHPAAGYDKTIDQTAFWIIPPGAEPPYYARTFDIFCPTISVQGKPVATNTKEDLAFTASVSGGGPVVYKWSVAGGRITSGQGTPHIWVKINKSMRVGAGMGVTATLRLTGLPEGGNCMDKASYTTIVAPLPNID